MTYCTYDEKNMELEMSQGNVRTESVDGKDYTRHNLSYVNDDTEAFG